MTSDATRFLANAERFSGVAGATTDWAAPSPCDGWSAGDVLGHVVDTQRDLFAQRGRPLGDRPAGLPAEVWSAHVEEITPHLLDDEWMNSTYDGYFGPTTVGDTVSRFYGFDLLVHGWDIAAASGGEFAWTDAEMDQIDSSADSFGPALHSEGICKAGVAAPAGASRQVILLARLGRKSG
ncbi:MAG: maleylpyruvate isomerase family mycothiol-dependent enzyme [Nocardioides sp.]